MPIASVILGSGVLNSGLIGFGLGASPGTISRDSKSCRLEQLSECAGLRTGIGIRTVCQEPDKSFTHELLKKLDRRMYRRSFFRATHVKKPVPLSYSVRRLQVQL